MYIGLNPTQQEVIRWFSETETGFPETPIKSQPDAVDTQALNLLRAELQHDDSLMSYLDNIIAMRRDVAVTMDNMFAQTPDEVMGMQEAIESIGDVNATETRVDADGTGKYDADTGLFTLNPIDFFLLEVVLNDRIPVSTLALTLTPVLKQTTPKKWVLQYTLGDISGDIIYWLDRACIQIIQAKKTLASWELTLKKGHCTQINGSLYNGVVACRYATQTNQQIRLKLGGWDTVLSRENQRLTGKFHRGKVTKSYTLSQKRSAKYVVSTHHIGEDRLVVYYGYIPGCPLPAWARGVIQNNAVPTQPIIVPPLLWQAQHVTPD